MKAFTASSMAVGFACSCAGPLKDTYGAYRVRSRAVESGLAAELHVRTSPDVSGAADIENETSHFLEEEAQPTSQPQGPSEGVARGDQPAPPSTGDARGEGRSRRGVMLYSGSVLSFIQEGRARHSVAAHRVLVICALMYWVGMALLPVLFGSSITGGIDASVPQAAVLYFFLLNVCSILGELWIVIHTEVGHYMILDCGESVCKAVTGNGMEEAMAVVSILFSALGRYDTFTDVVFTVMLWKTPPITQLVFTHTLHGAILRLPVPLHYVALFSLVCGVFGLQGVPGVILVCAKKMLPAAFKLNEFNLLLAIVDIEAKQRPAELGP
mmetsp:Transcript_48790/g.130225  ORF Transcript_48790/g.130225 Transcript_48790/m.130225 type:complete len:326 (-) Transcript_48790:132-1109(-)